MIKPIYTIFLALLIALFVGVGIDAFYPAPKEPQYPVEMENVKSCCEETPVQTEARVTFEKAQRKYMEDMKPYNLNVSIISLVASIIILILSLTLLNKIKMIADGILLGGVFSTMYSIMRGMMVENSQFRFLIITAGMLIALGLGYIKFIKPKENLQ